MEWEPPHTNGTGGYIRWYLDDEFIYGIRGKVLELTKTEIPSEPMYLIMNTAVASSWGFPKPCPDGCDCSCYQCGNSECTCGLPEGFCDNFPSTFQIDYVRVYQAKNHILGCSTADRPTEKYIKGHKEDYVDKFEGQKEPLLAIQCGGGYCVDDADCGSSTKGMCDNNKCVCSEGFTGPKCLSSDGYDDNPPLPEEIQFSQISLSPGMISTVAFFLVIFTLFVGSVVVMRRKQDATIYDSLSDAPNATNNFDTGGSILRGQDPISNYGQGSYQKGEGSRAPFNPMGRGANNDQKTVTYCMIDGRLLDDQKDTA